MSFVTIALLPLHMRHGFPHARHRAKHTGIASCPVDVGFLARLRKRTVHEGATPTASFTSSPARFWT